ncbi:ABC transporter ATP-binding protein [Variovorax sp. N23]|uniref:ABC transporter ATP-binding protein n=1 Tax=Variovorax sp. N23 TaxID=2980555 RepID=UPI0021C941CF|nr:ABC transporter ATP-binding protein [Variovorax sp. N23]MCU4121269.1 ABC transporter ATP-binding protein [Variovorax sp. N23]
MSSEIAIRVSGLSKCYQIYDSPRDRLKQFFRSSRLAGRGGKNYFREFWALRDISFEVKKGEVIGILGRNGSGKSTLLQLICGTLTPTAGRVETRGRIAALLELGSGFNPEFTGRENVYLNGAVLGLTREEMESRFAAIEAFADIGEFIDQAVKTYSSGMMVRLAFSVAVHVQPDILVVDEALSVGDIAFRNKCMEFIQRLVADGVTILFVTHDLGTLQLLCSRVVWLSHGEMIDSGDPIRIAQDYYVSSLPTQGPGSAVSGAKVLPQQNTGKAQFVDISLSGGEGGRFMLGEPFRLGFSVRALADLPKLVFAVSIYRADGDWVIGQTSREDQVFWNEVPQGQVCRGYLDFRALCLVPGDYLISVAAYNEDFSVCFAMTDLCSPFSVRSSYPTWGKFHHPCAWITGSE